MSDLRTRIAALLPTIFDRIADGQYVEWTEMADLLIGELHLTETDGNIIGSNHPEEQ